MTLRRPNKNIKMFFLTLFILCFLNLNCQNIKNITAYHVGFFYSGPYGGGYEGESIKLFGSKYTCNDAEFKSLIKKFLKKIKKSNFLFKEEIPEDVQLLIEIEYNNGFVERVYSWNNKQLNFKNKRYSENDYFVSLIEKYFDKISWSDSEKDSY